MFSLAYILLPFSDTPPADAIADALSRFRMGSRGDVPEEWLQFDDDTAHIEELYRADITFTKRDGLRTEGADPWYFDTSAVMAAMGRRDKTCWRVRFADIEPSVSSFAD